MVEYKDGRKKIISTSGNLDTDIIDITKVVGKNEVLSANSGHIIIKDTDSSMSYFIDIDCGEEKEIDIAHRLYQRKCKEVARYKLCDDIERVVYDDYDLAYLLSKEGAVRSYEKKENSILFKDDWGGKGYKSYYRITGSGSHINTIALLGSEVTTIGENKFGQLGDGTDLDYWDDWITIDTFICKELCADENYGEPYCIALDDSNNIWCWGRGFGSTPKIILGQGGIDEDIGDY